MTDHIQDPPPMTPSSPGPRVNHDGTFALAALAVVLLTLAAVEVREAHRWAAARVPTVTDYYRTGRP